MRTWVSRFAVAALTVAACLAQPSHAQSSWPVLMVQNLPGLFESGASLTPFNGQLWYADVGNNNVPYIASSQDGAAWSQGITALDILPHTTMNPAIVEFNGQLWMAVTDLDGWVWLSSSSDGLTWSAPVQIPSVTASSAPALVVFNSQLVVGLTGGNTALYLKFTSDGINWTSHWDGSIGQWSTNLLILNPERSSAAPALAVFNSQLVFAFRGMDKNVYVSASNDGVTWPASVSLIIDPDTKAAATTAPALAVFGGQLVLTFAGTDGGIHIAQSSNGLTWPSAPTHILSQSFAHGGTGPGLAVFNERLYLSVIGTDHRPYLVASECPAPTSGGPIGSCNPPTNPPTTEAPTTEAPTTAVPTTEAPTTLPPTPTPTPSPAGLCPPSLFTTPSGTFGVTAPNYVDNQRCGITVAADQSSWFLVDIPSFDSEAGYDYLRIFAVTSPGQESLVWTGNGIILQTSLTIQAQSLRFEWTTDGSVTRQGWIVNYQVEPTEPAPTSPVAGRYVILANDSPSVCLNVAEVSVFDLSGSNVALSRPVNQSGYWDANAFPPSNLVDNVFNNFAHSSCGHSSDPNQALVMAATGQVVSTHEWMMIDLGSDITIASITVSNRQDCCQERLGSVKLIIFNEQQQQQFRSNRLTGDMAQTITLPTPPPPPTTEAPTTAVPTPVSCSAGSFRDSNNVCAPCLPGTFSNSTGTSSCTACPAGQWSAAGSLSCTACEAGFIMIPNADFELGDIMGFVQNTVQLCRGSCAALPDCAAFTWNTGGNTCWLKRGPRNDLPYGVGNAISGLRCPA